MHVWQNWLQQIAAGFYRQTRREQWLLLVGGACLVIYLVYFMLLQPLQELAAREQQKAALLRQSLAEVQQMAQQLQQLQQDGEPAVAAPAVNLAELVDRSLRAHGLRMRGFQPGAAGEAQLRLDNVRFANLVSWLHQLESREQIVISELSVSAADEPGKVAVSLRLLSQTVGG